MKPKTLTLLIITVIIMTSMACGPSAPDVTPTPNLPSIEELQQDKEHAKLLGEKGGLLHDNHKYEEAIEMLNQAIDFWPNGQMYLDRAAARYDLFRKLAEQGLHEEALAIHRQRCEDVQKALNRSEDLTSSFYHNLRRFRDICHEELKYYEKYHRSPEQ
jgi:tetratricopeptide (TPR) repeat protein